jgi:hypothetical protein
VKKLHCGVAFRLLGSLEGKVWGFEKFSSSGFPSTSDQHEHGFSVFYDDLDAPVLTATVFGVVAGDRRPCSQAAR